MHWHDADGLSADTGAADGDRRARKAGVQAYINEGACACRASAAPDVLTSNGKPRSAKATSCVGVEGDHAAFGTRADRLESCAKQREAWKLNLELVFDLLTTVSTPLPSNDRAQGDVANFNKMKSPCTRRGAPACSPSRSWRRRRCSSARRGGAGTVVGKGSLS